MSDNRALRQAHDEYDRLTGQVVHTFTTTQYDPKRKAWIKRTVEYIDIGRPDPVVPGDTEAVIADEPWPRETNNSEAARAANLKRKVAREAEMQASVMDYLRKHGPAHCRMISDDLELPYSTLNEHMRRFANRTYTRVDKRGIAVIWGLVGIHNKEVA